MLMYKLRLLFFEFFLSYIYRCIVLNMYFEMPNIQQEQHTLAWVDEGRQKVSFKCTQASCSIQFLNGNDVFAIQLLVLAKLFRPVILGRHKMYFTIDSYYIRAYTVISNHPSTLFYCSKTLRRNLYLHSIVDIEICRAIFSRTYLRCE